MTTDTPRSRDGGAETSEARPAPWAKPDYQVVETALEVTLYYSAEV